jgi:hypothetical protein
MLMIESELTEADLVLARGVDLVKVALTKH